jgi:hypothetical protein
MISDDIGRCQTRADEKILSTHSDARLTDVYKISWPFSFFFFGVFIILNLEAPALLKRQKVSDHILVNEKYSNLVYCSPTRPKTEETTTPKLWTMNNVDGTTRHNDNQTILLTWYTCPCDTKGKSRLSKPEVQQRYCTYCSGNPWPAANERHVRQWRHFVSTRDPEDGKRHRHHLVGEREDPYHHRARNDLYFNG